MTPDLLSFLILSFLILGFLGNAMHRNFVAVDIPILLNALLAQLHLRLSLGKNNLLHDVPKHSLRILIDSLHHLRCNIGTIDGFVKDVLACEDTLGTNQSLWGKTTETTQPLHDQ